MLDPPAIVDPCDCTQCSHQTAFLFQLDRHVQRNHKNVYTAELFNAIVEPEQFSCIRCKYKSYDQFELYKHFEQAHNARTRINKNMSFCEEFVGYPCVCCGYKAYSSLCLAKHRYMCEKMSPSGRPRDSSAEDGGAESLHLNSPDARTSREVGTMESNISPHSQSKRKGKNASKFMTRRRSTNLSRWQVTQSKEARNSGEAYFDSDGYQVVEKRRMAPGCVDNCRSKCSTRISENQRLKQFEFFWKLGDKTRQWDFIRRSTRVCEPQQRTTEWESRRNSSRSYFLISEGEEIKVCIKMFLGTFGISEQWVRTAVSKINTGLPDRRGKHNRARRSIKPSIKDSVRMHINQFPRVPHCRKNSTKEYLEQGLSVKKMFSLYLQHAEEQQYKDIATERQYRDIFNTEFNLFFNVLKKDQCDICMIWLSSSDKEKNELRDTYVCHHKNKDAVRKIKDLEKKEARQANSSICVACFDLQVLSSPHGETSAFHYKRKLSVYNFTVYDMTDKQGGHCYVWHEGLGKRGPDEIGSFLLDFITKKQKEGVRDLRLYSDNAGQNKNRFVCAILLIAAVKYNIEITYRFLEAGHTQLEGDYMHALVGRRAKGREIFIPDDWYQIIKFAKVGRKPFIVTKVQQTQICSAKLVVLGQNWERDTEGSSVSWTNIRELHFNGSSPTEVQFKYDFDACYKTMCVHQARGLPIDLSKVTLEEAYAGMIPVASKKVDDLLELCTKGLIPKEYHTFYESLVRDYIYNDEET